MRVLAAQQRCGFDAEAFAILARQMPDHEKRARADYLIETVSLDAARAGVRDVIERIRRQLRHA